MTFLILLVVAVAVTVVFKKPIKRFPWVFYIVAALLSALYFANRVYGVPALDGIPRSLLLVTMQKGSLGVAFFVIVMYVGVFDRSSKVRSFLSPIRGELSIIAWILVLGHIAFYAMTYFPTMFGGGVFKGNVMASLVCGIVLFFLVMVLGITSISAIRKAMNNQLWKGIQRWAYLFYALVYAHMVAILLPSALGGAATARTSVIVYTVIFGVYLVLRIYRAVQDCKKTRVKEATGA